MANVQIIDHTDAAKKAQLKARWIEKLDGLIKLIEGTECQLKEIDKNYLTN
jgi:hypothetical protein